MKVFCLSLLTMLLFAANCKKPKHESPVDQLPPETQTGANTFGCLVNGEVFVPKGPSLGPILSCYYQFLNTNDSKGYYFQIDGNDNSQECNYKTLKIFTDSLPLVQGKQYALKNMSNGGATALYGILSCGVINNHFTSAEYQGELFIKKLDSINQIVSGTFWFNAVNSKGETVKITDGRFDVHYTR